MLDTINTYPETVFVAPEAGDKKVDFDFPKLQEKANYSMKLEPAYTLNEMGMAEKIQNRRGLAQQILKNADTGEPISFHTPEYRPVENKPLHDAVERCLKGFLPPQMQSDIYHGAYVENGGAYNQLNYGIRSYSAQIQRGEFKSYLSPTIIIKNASQWSVTAIVSAECSATGNIISLGNRAAVSARHVQSFETSFIEGQITRMLTDFPKYVRKMQEFLKTDINIEQATNALEMFSDISETERQIIMEQYIDVEADEMYSSKFALLQAVASYASKPDDFPIKNSEVADNVAETLAVRQRRLAKFASSPFFFGKAGA
jgi:hypothetical protein